MIQVGNMQFHPKAPHMCLFSIALFCTLYVFMSSMYFSRMSSPNKVIKPQGLTISGTQFMLDRKPFIIMSGSIHYFRVPHREWEDRILKLKAMGLNTVDIYIPWNVHEPRPNQMYFQNDSISISAFLYLLQTYNLYAVVRPGPYICSEWDFGGLPSWLLKDKHMKIRSMYPPFIDAVKRYFKELFKELKTFQYSFGGPIIAFQIENEYGSYGTSIDYMNYLKNLFIESEITELLFVSDNEEGIGKYGVIDGDSKFHGKKYECCIGQASEVPELWDGWFNHWGEKYHKVNADKTAVVIKKLLEEKASFNLYMWHGGSSFGFMSGANAEDDGSLYKADITSYDYDAPVGETGQVKAKYGVFKKTIKENAPKDAVSKNLPWIVEDKTFTNYGNIDLEHYITIDDLLASGKVKSIERELVCPMEEVDQAYGYIAYRKSVNSGKKLVITKARDYVLVLWNGNIIYSSWEQDTAREIDISNKPIKADNDLLILVENTGRVNYGRNMDNQRKGIFGTVTVDDNEVRKWKISSLDFEEDWTKSLAANQEIWKKFDKSKKEFNTNQPTLYKGELYVHGTAPRDTFIIVPGWFKGIVLVNGYNLGRYYYQGPQRTLFLPHMFLRPRENVVILFDLHGKQGKGEKPPTIESTADEDLGEKNSIDFLI